MDSLIITTGEKRLAINGDPENVLAFNPEDVVFVEKFYQLIGNFEKKLEEYKERGAQLEKIKAVDGNDLPINLNERIQLLHDACDYSRSQIDMVFGEGTSQKVFGSTMSLDVFIQFFEGITPYVKRVRETKVAKYQRPRRVKK